MGSAYTPKHSHILHARASDSALYYKILLMTMFGFTLPQISILTGTPRQTITRNFKKIRYKLARNENYKVEIYNRFYHADPHTGDYYGQWRDILNGFYPSPETKILSQAQKIDIDNLIYCLKECPVANTPKKFVKEDIVMGCFNNTAIPENFEPRTCFFPASMPILQNIDGFKDKIYRKSRCRGCRLHKRVKAQYLEIFTASPYSFIDMMFHLAHFQIRTLEDYPDHLYFAWFSGVMRGIHHMKANKTATKGLSLQEALNVGNTILLDFVDLTYDALADKVLPSLPIVE